MADILYYHEVCAICVLVRAKSTLDTILTAPIARGVRSFLRRDDGLIRLSMVGKFAYAVAWRFSVSYVTHFASATQPVVEIRDYLCWPTLDPATMS